MRDNVRTTGVVSLLFPFLLVAAPPAHAAAGVDRTSAGDQTYSGASWMDADACDPDLQPFTVEIMGSRPAVDVALDVVVSGRYAFVADGLSGLQVLDVSEATSPTIIGSYDTPGYAQGVAVSGDYAFVADGAGGLQIVDVSLPSSPGYVAGCQTNGFAYGVAVSGDYAFVGAGAGGLEVIDIGNPRVPALIGSYDVCGTAWGVAVSGRYAYVAGGASGLHVIDISVVTNPVLVGSYETRSMALGVAVGGEFAYVAGGASGLQIVSISDPASPMLIARSFSPTFAYGVFVRDNYAYVAGGANGLQVMQAQGSLMLGGTSSGPPTGLSDPSASSGGSGQDLLRGGSLDQNSPNPFMSTTRIAFSVEIEGLLKLNVFDARGRLVRELSNDVRAPGRYVERWDGRDGNGRKLPAGTYFCRLEGPGWADMKKMLLVQ